MLHDLLAAFIKLNVFPRTPVCFFVDLTVLASCYGSEWPVPPCALIPVLAFDTGFFMEKVPSFGCFLVVRIQGIP
jgi:hypothetical protein